MDAYDSAPLEPVISEKAVPIPRAPRASRWSGWLIGAVLGVLASLWAFPSVRYTLLAQLEFALAEDSVPWLSSLDADRSAREVPLLDQVAARNSDDYLLQVGRATAFASARIRHEPVRGRRRAPRQYDDHTLGRLGEVTRLYPTLAGSYAHLARYLMADRVRIRRPELSAQRAAAEAGATGPDIGAPAAHDVEIMLWALNTGEKLDGDNAFWPAMLATTFFAAGEDKKALDALARASRKARWDAYIYEEVLGQWRLYSAAYGDHGAMQQIGPLSLVVFPHLHEMRRMAEMARWEADRLAERGKPAEAAKVRRYVEHLGENLRDNARWAFEALYGTDLFFIACTDSDSVLTPSRIRTPAEWEPQAARYHKLLVEIGRAYEYKIVRNEVGASCDLRKRVDLARYDASYPGIPPGIPLMPLFGNWMGGICLVQQALGLAGAVLLAWIWETIGRRYGARRNVWRNAGIALIALATGAALYGFINLLTTPRMAGLVMAGVTVLSIAALEAGWRAHRRRHGIRPAHWASDAAPGAPNPAEQAAARWTRGTTVRMLLLIVVPYLAVLYTNRGELSGLHPVAILLTSLTGIPRATGIRDSIELAMLASALPLAIPLVSALWGLYRRISPAAGALLGLRRLALPTFVLLIAAYAVLLNRMLVLDGAASQAIQKAALNDRQWVLTHGPENPF